MMKHLEELAETLLKVKTKEQMYNLLLGLFTPRELKELPNRIKIVKMLKKGIPHQEISERLRVGIATVTRGSKEIQLGRFKYI